MKTIAIAPAACLLAATTSLGTRIADAAADLPRTCAEAAAARPAIADPPLLRYTGPSIGQPGPDGSAMHDVVLPPQA